MRIYKEMDLECFDTWGNANLTKNDIISAGRCEEFDAMITEIYPDGLTSTELNDLLRFDSKWIYEALAIKFDEEDCR